MKHLARKIAVFLSLVCYFAAVSVASVHAFPMIESSESPSTMSAMMLDQADVEGNCHTPNSPPCEQSESTACQIFCAAMAQAMASAFEITSFDVKPTVSVAAFHSAILSRQLAVEPHPPK